MISIVQKARTDGDAAGISATTTTQNQTDQIIDCVAYSAIVLDANGAMLGASRNNGARSALRSGKAMQESLYVPISGSQITNGLHSPAQLIVRAHLFKRTVLSVRECPFPMYTTIMVLDGSVSRDGALQLRSITISRAAVDTRGDVSCQLRVLVVNSSSDYFERVIVMWRLVDAVGDDIENGEESAPLMANAMVALETSVSAKSGRFDSASLRMSFSYLKEVAFEEAAIELTPRPAESNGTSIDELTLTAPQQFAESIRCFDKFEFWELLEAGDPSLLWINPAAVGGEDKLRAFRAQLAPADWLEVRLRDEGQAVPVNRLLLVIPEEPAPSITREVLWRTAVRAREMLVIVASRTALRKVLGSSEL